MKTIGLVGYGMESPELKFDAEFLLADAFREIAGDYPGTMFVVQHREDRADLRTSTGIRGWDSAVGVDLATCDIIIRIGGDEATRQLVADQAEGREVQVYERDL